MEQIACLSTAGFKMSPNSFVISFISLGPNRWYATCTTFQFSRLFNGGSAKTKSTFPVKSFLTSSLQSSTKLLKHTSCMEQNKAIALTRSLIAVLLSSLVVKNTAGSFSLSRNFLLLFPVWLHLFLFSARTYPFFSSSGYFANKLCSFTHIYTAL